MITIIFLHFPSRLLSTACLYSTVPAPSSELLRLQYRMCVLTCLARQEQQRSSKPKRVSQLLLQHTHSAYMHADATYLLRTAGDARASHCERVSDCLQQDKTSSSTPCHAARAARTSKMITTFSSRRRGWRRWLVEFPGRLA